MYLKANINNLCLVGPFDAPPTGLSFRIVDADP